MKLITKSLLLLLLISTPCFAGKKVADFDDDPPKMLVSAVTPGTQAGTGTIAVQGGTPFTVDSNATIILDGATATLAQVKPGMQVLTQSAPGTTFGEIDLKTVPPDSSSTPRKKKTNQ